MRGPALAKVVFDRTVSAVALILLLPVLLCIGMAVRLGSPGPVLFRQTRIGKGGRPFTLLKFRSMVDGADRLPNVSPDGDPRVTRVGRFLRQWYLDELPQLVNVARGDMSLVGPRPETPEWVAKLHPDELALLDVVPGIVGPSTLAMMDESRLLAESGDPVSYYATTLVHVRARYDLQYLASRSLLSDLALIFRQLIAIIAHGRHRGAPRAPAVGAPPDQPMVPRP